MSSKKLTGYTRQTLFILGAVAIMVMYAETMLVPALPDIGKDFEVPYNILAWVLTIYLLAGGVATPLCGKLGDMYGKKKILLICMGAYGLGVTLTGFAPNIMMMLTFRGLQGIGMAMFPLAFGIIRDEFPRERMAVAQGVVSSMFGVGSSMGLVIGGAITQQYGWRTTYHTIIPITIFLILLIKWRIRESPIKIGGKPDYLGAFTLAASLISFLLALTNGGEWGWTSPNVIILFMVSVIFLITFLKIERILKSPLLDPKLMKQRNILTTNFIIFIVGFNMFTIFQSVAILVRSPPPIGLALSVFEAGLIQLPFSLVMLMFGTLSGFITAKFGPRRPMIFGMLGVTFGFLSLYLFHSSALSLILAFIIIAVGMSLGMVATINMVILSVQPQFTGITTAINSLFRVVGGVIGPVVAGVYMTVYSVKILTDSIYRTFPSEQGFQLIFLTAMIASIICIILAFNTKDVQIRP